MCCKHDLYTGSAKRAQAHDRQGIGCLQRASARGLASSVVLQLVERDIDLPDRARRYAAVLHKLAKQLTLRDRRTLDRHPGLRRRGRRKSRDRDLDLLQARKDDAHVLADAVHRGSLQEPLQVGRDRRPGERRCTLDAHEFNLGKADRHVSATHTDLPFSNSFLTRRSIQVSPSVECVAMVGTTETCGVSVLQCSHSLCYGNPSVERAATIGSSRNRGFRILQIGRICGTPLAWARQLWSAMGKSARISY